MKNMLSQYYLSIREKTLLVGIMIFISLIISGTIYTAQSEIVINDKLQLLLRRYIYKQNNKEKINENNITSNNNTVIIKSDNTIDKLSTGYQISITIDSENNLPTNKNILGFSTAFGFTLNEADKKEKTKKLSKDLSPMVLRFPGGTLGNYYHPEGKGYGLKKSEFNIAILKKEYEQQLKLSTNALDDYIAFSKEIGNKTIYVANILTGEPEEVLYALKKLQDAGIEIAGVELGNELYFGEYRSRVPDVKAYIKLAKKFATIIKSTYPDIKLGVIAPKNQGEAGGTPRPGSFNNTWNEELSKENFYDAYIVHDYLDDTTCKANMNKLTIDKNFECGDNLITEFNNIYINNLFKYLKGYYDDKEIWFTERNIKTPSNMIGSTFLHASYITETLMNLNKSDYNIGISTYHNFLAENFGYATINISKGDATTTAGYYAHKFISSIINDGGSNIGYTISSQNELVGTGVKIQVFYDKDKKRTYIRYLNKTKERIKIDNIEGVEYTTKKISYMQGNYLYSSIGNAPITRLYPSKKDEIQMNDGEEFDGYIKPISIGVIELE